MTFIPRYNIITVMFLGLFSIPGIGTVWLSYVLPISCFAVIPLFLTVKEEYNRLNKYFCTINGIDFVLQTVG